MEAFCERSRRQNWGLKPRCIRAFYLSATLRIIKFGFRAWGLSWFVCVHSGVFSKSTELGCEGFDRSARMMMTKRREFPQPVWRRVKKLTVRAPKAAEQSQAASGFGVWGSSS